MGNKIVFNAETAENALNNTGLIGLSNTSEVKTMSSLEIAELTGKRHDNVTADIEKMLKDLEIHAYDFSETAFYEVNNAKRSRKIYNLPKELADLLLTKYKGLSRVPHRLREESSLKTIEQLLGISLIRQYKCLDYRIDGYHPETNTAYEIDEPEHKGKEKQDAERQSRIEAVLGCKFVRIKL